MGHQLTGTRGITSGSRKQHPSIHVNCPIGYKTDSDEDVVFVAEKGVASSREIIFDQAKRLALQREIDQQSQPKQPAKPLTSLGSAAVEGPGERMKMKVEEDKSEGKIVKKKKQKKEPTSLPETNNCTVHDGSLAEVKKEKKKSKKVKAIMMDVEPLNGDVGGEKKKKKKSKTVKAIIIDTEPLNGDVGGEKKKKKKSKTVTAPLNDADGSDVKSENEEGFRKEKKKKKKPADDENPVETAEISVKEEEVQQRVKKQKKVKNKSEQVKSEHLKLKKEEVKDDQAEEDKLPKKAKKAKNCCLLEGTDTEEKVKEKKKKTKTTKGKTAKAEEENNVNKKKKTAKTKVAKDVVKVEILETETVEVEELKVKKKRKKPEGNQAGTPPIKGKNTTSKVNKDDILNKKEKSTESQTVILEEEKVELKKNGKGRKTSVEVSEEEETEPKKKKRKKREEGEPLEVECEEAEKRSEDASKKRKRKQGAVKEETQDVSVETSVKKKKIKEEVKDEHEVPQTDVVFLSAKSGNTDEVTINQERRQALQMEVDQASQPKKLAKPAGFGQWSTAQFDNSEQQQKFLRLMGGFKKSFQPASGSTGGANMALGKDAQHNLQQGLLGQFERAQSRRVDFNNKGAGLGFSAPSNKKFAIDINASRSIRFDD
ncbi:uncharacterized protein knop1 [Tautogolabrus adspersus]